ncbi:MAG: hypothetical protein ACE5KE_06935 [Methanosarcinales archaeon]
MKVVSVVQPENISSKDTVLLSTNKGLKVKGYDPLVIVEHGGFYIKMPLSELIASIEESKELSKNSLFKEVFEEYKNKKGKFEEDDLIPLEKL